MVVQTTTALASGQFSEKMGSLEAEKTRLNESLSRTTHDYSRLLELSENLTEQLEDKSLSFIQLDKESRVRIFFLAIVPFWGPRAYNLKHPGGGLPKVLSKIGPIYSFTSVLF